MLLIPLRDENYLMPHPLGRDSGTFKGSFSKFLTIIPPGILLHLNNLSGFKPSIPLAYNIVGKRLKCTHITHMITLFNQFFHKFNQFRCFFDSQELTNYFTIFESHHSRDRINLGRKKTIFLQIQYNVQCTMM